MPEYWVEPFGDPTQFESQQIRNKLPKQGSWFDMGDRTPAQVRQIRMIGGEPVIFARLGSDDDLHSLKPSRD
jgi:hypothetical protein